jgi:DNA-binding NtrC family response regulator
MRRLFPVVERIAASDVPVIIEGETGTGKEVLAESIHEAGKRASGPFVVFDCTAVPPALVESALFGHERGAFTGAVSSRQGVFEQAHGGTLLIDEIGDLDIALQAKLLRAIERSQVQRVGGSQYFQFDVRILCATRRDLEREIQEGRFRDDLYYRLAVARLELPPLRKREGDIALLAAHFWESAGGEPGGLTPQILNRFKAYAWPGNVRELRNAVAHELALGDLADADSIRRGRVSEARGDAKDPATDVVQSVIDGQLPYMLARERVMSDFDRRYCEALLERFGGNVTKASAASGIGRRYFYVLRARAAKSTP